MMYVKPEVRVYGIDEIKKIEAVAGSGRGCSWLGGCYLVDCFFM